MWQCLKKPKTELAELLDRITVKIQKSEKKILIVELSFVYETTSVRLSDRNVCHIVADSFQ